MRNNWLHIEKVPLGAMYVQRTLHKGTPCLECEDGSVPMPWVTGSGRRVILGRCAVWKQRVGMNLQMGRKERGLGLHPWLRRALETEAPFKVADVISSKNLLLCWGNCSLLTGAVFSSLTVGFSSKAFFQETTAAKRSCHWGVDKPKCLLVWIKFWHQVFWIIKALHHAWTPRDCTGRGQWPRFAVYLRECTFSWPASWTKGRNWSPKASLSKADLKNMS